MGIAFYDQDKVLISANPLRTVHDGRLGGADEKLIYFRNDDVAKYYTNIEVVQTNASFNDFGEFGTTGWGVKFISGERRPTEAEWDAAVSGATLNIANIGSTSSADTSTFLPVWVRVVSPGGDGEQIRENQIINLSYFVRNVGA